MQSSPVLDTQENNNVILPLEKKKENWIMPTYISKQRATVSVRCVFGYVKEKWFNCLFFVGEFKIGGTTAGWVYGGNLFPLPIVVWFD